MNEFIFMTDNLVRGLTAQKLAALLRKWEKLQPRTPWPKK